MRPALMLGLALACTVACGRVQAGAGQRARANATISSSTSSSSSSASSSSSIVVDSTSSGGTGRLDFTTSFPWRLDAAWSCAQPGATFGLELRRADGTLVRRLAKRGAGRVSLGFAEEGDFHAEIDSSCAWHVTVVGP